ncbi:gag-pol protein [Lasius niger]|uniref:Gag-pol protein n=1 Tax=Lasius niger TaxID=67767 RepID=A0A0J7K470_LASNI|nr:gag-pol protein [Lasius niger]
MYRQILVHPGDRNLQRIVWRSNESETVREYNLNTVTYGLACAPYLALRTLRQLASDEERTYPQGATVLRRDTYVDDILTGANILEEDRTIQQKLTQLCTAGGFLLKKWWHPREDAFSFKVTPMETKRVTKRAVLSQTARLFDPLGWLVPVVVKAKVLIQSMWLQQLDWDEPVTSGDEQAWLRIQIKLPVLGEMRVPRWLCTGRSDGRVELHGFADASERAYAAAVYAKACSNEADGELLLLTAKTKVAPIRQVSLPRLELCAATLLAKLMNHVQKTMELTDAPTHLWWIPLWL